MDPAAFAALVEQCAPTPDLVRTLTAIVRQASSFEPLLITIEGRKPIPIQATNRDEAIQLATEAIAAGQQVRTGLAQLDAKETKQAGLTAATTFDACKHIAGLGKLFDARLQAANMKSADRDQAFAQVVVSFAARAPGTTPEPRTSRRRPPVLSVPLATPQSLLLHPRSASLRAGTSIARDWALRPLCMTDEAHHFSYPNSTPRSGLVRLHINRGYLMTSPLKHSAALLCMGAVLSIALTAPALAQTANIEGVLQNIVTMLTGNVARLLATLAVIIVGIAWMFGYLDLRKAAYVVLGVAITFGASEVVSTLTGGR